MTGSLTIIIPAFNESKRVSSCLKDIDEYISRKSKAGIFYVIVVDDGSLDDTKEVVDAWVRNEAKNKKCFSLVSYLPNRGKGYAVREGFLKATTEFVMYTDADGACPIEEVERLISGVESGYDIACGSRILRDEKVKVSMGIKRRGIGFIFHLILRLLGFANLRDTQCGFKLFKTQVARRIVERQKCFNYTFDVEYLFLAKKMGYKIKEVAVNWYHVEGSKVNLLKDSVKMLLEVLKIRFIYKYN